MKKKKSVKRVKGHVRTFYFEITSVYTCLSAYTPFTLEYSSLHLCPSTILRTIVNTNIYLSHGVHTEKDYRQFESIQYLLGYREYAYQVPISTYYSNYNRGFIVFLSYIAQLYRYRKYYLYFYTTNLLVVIPREPFKKSRCYIHTTLCLLYMLEGFESRLARLLVRYK